VSEPALLPKHRVRRGEKYVAAMVARRCEVDPDELPYAHIDWYDEESGECYGGTTPAPADYVFDMARETVWTGDPDEPYEEWAIAYYELEWGSEYDDLCNAMQEAKRSADDRRLDGLRRPLRRKVAAQLQREVRRRWIAALLATVRRRANAVGLVTGTAQVRTRSTGPPPPSAPTSSSSLVRTLTAAPAAPPVALAA
jgi:hypothetical protein